MATIERIEKPSKIILAQRLFYLVIGIAVIRKILTIIRHADVRSPQDMIIGNFLIYTSCLFLIYQLGKGKNWARWSLVLILSFSFPLAILPAFDMISHNPIQTLLVCIELIIYLIGLVCLFHKSSSHWFSTGKIIKKQN